MRIEREISVVADAEALRERTMALARRLGLQFAGIAGERPVAADGLVLALNESHLEMRDAKTRPGRGVFVDFSTLNVREAAKRGGFSRRQPLGRAVGKDSHRIIDCTAGLAHDSALLACMSYEVLAVERSAVIAALVENGLRRAEQDEALREALGGRLSVLNAEARDVLRERGREFDAAYIDPMFPPKRKASALAKKSIRWVGAIVGRDEDAAELVDTARRHVRRVVVKRPHEAPPLCDRPAFVIESKLVRYDVYVNERAPAPGRTLTPGPSP